MQLTQDKSPIPQRLGPYVLGKRLGGGGMGDVYEASHTLMARRVAIKLLKPHLADNREFVQRFLREISALGVVQAHPNLVRAEFADIADNIPYLVMEFVVGIDLSYALKCQGPFSISDACNLICQAAQGLDAIHQAGLVHRDLKPSNLMLTHDGLVKVLDLGLARLQVTAGPGDELTSANCALGTMDYTAPEQAEDPRTVDIRADIYSLGCTMYKLVTGQVPFAGCSTMAQKIRAHASMPFPDMPAESPPELQPIVAKMVAKRPADRFADPAELVAALRAFCQASTIKPVMTLLETSSQFVEPLQETPSKGDPQTISFHSPVSHAPTRPLHKTKRLSGRAKVAVMIGALGPVILVALVLLLYRDAGDPYDVDRLEPMKWHPLFVREPVKLIWTKTDRAGHTTFDVGMQHFFITNHDTAYFKIGSTQSRDYKFQVALSTVAWERVGVFFGYRTPSDDPSLAAGDIARFQYVSFGFVGEKPDLALQRGRAMLKFGQDGTRIVPFIHSLKLTELDIRNGEKVLEVSVSKKDHVKIFLDGVNMRELANLDPGDVIPQEDFRGAFGIFTHNNSCHFHDARAYVFASSE